MNRKWPQKKKTHPNTGIGQHNSTVCKKPSHFEENKFPRLLKYKASGNCQSWNDIWKPHFFPVQKIQHFGLWKRGEPVTSMIAKVNQNKVGPFHDLLRQEGQIENDSV